MKSPANKLWVFDFDGTLVDSESAIRKCYVAVTRKLAPSLVARAQSILIGPTLDESSREILGETHLERLEEFKKEFQYEYDSNTVFETPTYPKVEQVLKFLLDRGDKMSIATNKRSGPTHALLKHFQWESYFEFVACIDEFTNQKNKTEMVAHMLTKHAQFRTSYFVGDTLSDGIAAKENKLRFIKAQYGYGNNQDWREIPIYKTIAQVDELLVV
jgi:phosphoglycolate phosphatase